MPNKRLIVHRLSVWIHSVRKDLRVLVVQLIWYLTAEGAEAFVSAVSRNNLKDIAVGCLNLLADRLCAVANNSVDPTLHVKVCLVLSVELSTII